MRAKLLLLLGASLASTHCASSEPKKAQTTPELQLAVTGLPERAGTQYLTGLRPAVHISQAASSGGMANDATVEVAGEAEGLLLGIHLLVPTGEGRIALSGRTGLLPDSDSQLSLDVDGTSFRSRGGWVEFVYSTAEGLSGRFEAELASAQGEAVVISGTLAARTLTKTCWVQPQGAGVSGLTPEGTEGQASALVVRVEDNSGAFCSAQTLQ